MRRSWDGAYDHRDPFLEPLVLFAWLARECNLEFVTDVMVLPQRQTALVAKQVATIELLAPGRIRLGVGIGWNAVEYDVLGVDFASHAAGLEEQMPLLRRLWSEASVDFSGVTEHVDAAGIAPLPPRTLPIWIGSGADPRRPAGWVDSRTDGSPCRMCNPAGASRTRGSTSGRRHETHTGTLRPVGLEGHVHARGDDLDRVQTASRSMAGCGCRRRGGQPAPCGTCLATPASRRTAPECGNHHAMIGLGTHGT